MNSPNDEGIIENYLCIHQMCKAPDRSVRTETECDVSLFKRIEEKCCCSIKTDYYARVSLKYIWINTALIIESCKFYVLICRYSNT